MTYTSHGHHIPGTPMDSDQPTKVWCGGIGSCFPCSAEARAALTPEKNLSENERVLRQVNLALLEAGLTVHEVAASVTSMTKHGIVFSLKKN